MHSRLLLCFAAVALVGTACGTGDADDETPHSTPEGAVVSWFDAVDTRDTATASDAIHPESLALIFAIENDVSTELLAEYLSHGVPLEMQETYWDSFGRGFTDFASKPLSTLTVGQASVFDSDGEEFASVPVSGGPGADSIVFVRKRADGTWEVDMVASLGDGFSKLLLDLFDELDSSEAAVRVRLAYAEVVAPSMRAAMTEGSFGDSFAVTALTLLSHIEDSA